MLKRLCARKYLEKPELKRGKGFVMTEHSEHDQKKSRLAPCTSTDQVISGIFPGHMLE